ncbi:MAG: DinB family protein [Prosthecobacter sp.]
MPADAVLPDSECLFADNARLLLDGADLLEELSVEDFVMEDERCLGGSIGGHARHCVEFYQGFIQGLGEGRMDYDVRARNLLIESDPATACEALRELAKNLTSLAGTEDIGRGLQIVENHNGEEPAWSASSVGRELRFLLSHTIHHYALIAVLLRLRGMALPETFGVAPSTLRHRARQTMTAACAR